MNGKWTSIECHLSVKLKKNITIEDSRSVSGGCINQAYKLTDNLNNQWFIKTNDTSKASMFLAEELGLKEIEDSNTIRVPKTICNGTSTTGSFSYLVLEYIPLNASVNQKETGYLLAKMHQHQMNSFGWKIDNTIGATPQSNKQHSNWVSFWREERLMFQLELAHQKGYSNKDYDDGLKLAEELEVFFESHSPVASLLHGDLWGGNCAMDEKNQPVIFDPAVYYGDRETDIAMTELFGGFNSEFYAAYNSEYPLDEGYKVRKTLYNLYHILNHYNLFGGGYASQAANMTRSLLSEI